ncbi:SDR family NAD(P)-dependent oxidoreductase [Salinarimonas chemoclinalis]|uniref:SDR family NAD(P)-dependent oxidoreductase n=1 Tax=Salinarimonas chemoclinalis TaxID=3241599 RepID=UPI003557A348
MASDTRTGLHDYGSVRYRSLKGRAVVITGGASGIGAEMVRAFAAQEAQVAFLDIDEAAGRALAGETGAAFDACDITDIAALRATLARIEARYEGVAALVNNAGRDDRHAMESVEPDYWRRALALNLDHHFFATQALAPGMAERGGGSVIMLGSISWMRGRPGMVGYTTAKAALNGLTKTLARELGASGIRVNCLVPGAILTERQEKLWLTPELNRQFLDLQALKFRLDASHVARMALFLASEESAGCTGANFVVDAGLTQN